MRKEILVAIILGIGLGGVIAFGIWRANLALKPKEVTQAVNQTPGPSDQPQASDLLITQPENGLVVPTNTVTIKGSTTPNAILVFLGGNKPVFGQASQDGSFSQDIGLANGANEITVTAYDQNGSQARQKIMLVYSTDFPGNQ